MAKKNNTSFALTALLMVVAVLVGFVGGFYGYTLVNLPQSDETPKTSMARGEMDIYFLELGNKYTGDCTYIRVGDVDILIDAGSHTSSVSTISAFLNEHMADDVLDYVIVTHAHQDHYAGFATSNGTDSLFDLYQVGTIIDFALTNQSSTAAMYSNYVRERNEEIAAGAKHLTARECIESGQDEIKLSDDVTMKVLDQKYYYEKAESENDYSVCLLFSQGDYHYLFTGDLEAEGEESLVERNDLPQVMLYKAGHHGSKTSSTSALMSVIKPQIVCVCCCAGSSEYTSTDANQFPTQQFIDRVAPYTDKIYVTTLCIDYSKDQYTSMNGNILVSIKNGKVTVEGSNSNKILKEWDWFKEHRTMPSAWQ